MEMEYSPVHEGSSRPTQPWTCNATLMCDYSTLVTDSLNLQKVTTDYPECTVTCSTIRGLSRVDVIIRMFVNCGSTCSGVNHETAARSYLTKVVVSFYNLPPFRCHMLVVQSPSDQHLSALTRLTFFLTAKCF